MPQLPGLVPSVFTIVAYVVCIKLAARLFRQTLSWKHAAVFGGALFLVLLAVSTCLRALNLASDPVSASLLDIATGLLAQLAVGAWILGRCARTPTGGPIGFKRGALLALVAYALVFLLGIAATFLLPLLARTAGIPA